MTRPPAQVAHGGQCGGKNRSGSPCRLPAGFGTSHPGWGRCRHHAGASPTHERSVAEAQARAACAKFGLPVRTTAAQALRDELARSNGAVVYLLAKVQQLDEAELVWGTEKRTVRTNPGQGAERGVPQVEVTQSARVHVWVSLLFAERQHLARLAADMARIGIEERVARVTEAQVTLLNRLMDALHADAELTPRQLQLVAENFPRRLREVGGA